MKNLVLTAAKALKPDMQFAKDIVSELEIPGDVEEVRLKRVKGLSDDDSTVYGTAKSKYGELTLTFSTYSEKIHLRVSVDDGRQRPATETEYIGTAFKVTPKAIELAQGLVSSVFKQVVLSGLRKKRNSLPLVNSAIPNDVCTLLSLISALEEFEELDPNYRVTGDTLELLNVKRHNTKPIGGSLRLPEKIELNQLAKSIAILEKNVKAADKIRLKDHAEFGDEDDEPELVSDEVKKWMKEFTGKTWEEVLEEDEWFKPIADYFKRH